MRERTIKGRMVDVTAKILWPNTFVNQFGDNPNIQFAYLKLQKIIRFTEIFSQSKTDRPLLMALYLYHIKLFVWMKKKRLCIVFVSHSQDWIVEQRKSNNKITAQTNQHPVYFTCVSFTYNIYLPKTLTHTHARAR